MKPFKQLVAVLCSALMLGLSATTIAAEKKAALTPNEAKAKQAYALGVQAYIWGYPMVVMQKSRDAMTKSGDAPVTPDQFNKTGKFFAPVNQVATLHAPDPRMITIQPWDSKIIPNIEKAILNSTLGFNHSNDGTIIRVPVPTLTEEKRQQIVKLLKKMAEETKIAIRNERRASNDSIKKLEKNKEIAEDELKKSYEKTQKLTDENIKKIDKIAESKEREILEI